MGTRGQTDTRTLRGSEKLRRLCFNWVAALGQRGGQEFGPPATLTFHTYSIFFLCRLALLYFFVVYNSALLYDLFVSSPLGGVGAAVGRAEELLEKVTGRGLRSAPLPFRVTPIVPLGLPFFSSPSLLLLDLIFSVWHLLRLHPLQFQSIFPPFLISSASPGWETGHSCRGTASLSRVALSRALTKTYRHELPWQPPSLSTALL